MSAGKIVINTLPYCQVNLENAPARNLRPNKDCHNFGVRSKWAKRGGRDGCGDLLSPAGNLT